MPNARVASLHRVSLEKQVVLGPETLWGVWKSLEKQEVLGPETLWGGP